MPIIEAVIIQAVSSSSVCVLVSLLHSQMRVLFETPIDGVRVAATVGALLVGTIVLFLAVFHLGVTAYLLQ